MIIEKILLWLLNMVVIKDCAFRIKSIEDKLINMYYNKHFKSIEKLFYKFFKTFGIELLDIKIIPNLDNSIFEGVLYNISLVVNYDFISSYEIRVFRNGNIESLDFSYILLGFRKDIEKYVKKNIKTFLKFDVNDIYLIKAKGEDNDKNNI